MSRRHLTPAHPTYTPVPADAGADSRAGERERELRALLDQTVEMLGITDASGRITHANSAWLRALDMSEEEVLSVRIASLVAPLDRRRFLDTARRVREGEPVAEIETVLLGAGARRLVCRMRAVPIVRDGRFRGAYVVVHDVTERSRAEAIRARLATTLEATSDIVKIITARGDVVFANRAAREALGIDTDEPPENIHLADHRSPADHDYLMRVAIPTALRDGTWEGETTLIGALGTPIPVSVVLVSHPSTRLGEPPFFVSAVMRDLRDRARVEAVLRASEGRKQAMLDSALDCVIAADADGRIVEFNPAAERTFGWMRDEVLGKRMADVVIPEALRESHSGAFARAVRTGETRLVGRRLEMTALRRDGTTFPCEIAIARIDDEPPVFTAYLRDITDRRRGEMLKNQLVATVSHELRTPLTAVRGAADLLNKRWSQGLDEKGKTLLDMMVRNTDHLVRLVNDLVDIERIESGAALMEPFPADAEKLVREACDLTRPVAEQAGVRLTTEVTPAQVWADSGRIVQVLTNLVANAIKFSPAGGTVHVTVTAGPTPQQVRFTVRDEGRGIPADRLERVFERFEQVDPSDARERGGAGLGLAICRAIVVQHGGRIWAESVYGAGSTFVFLLPTAEAALEELER